MIMYMIILINQDPVGFILSNQMDILKHLKYTVITVLIMAAGRYVLHFKYVDNIRYQCIDYNYVYVP